MKVVYRIVVFLAISLVFLFYPGLSLMSYYSAYIPETFEQKSTTRRLLTHDIPTFDTSVPFPIVSAEGYLIIDRDSFTEIIGKNERSLFYPASTAKIITALVVNDLYRPTDVITIPSVFSEGQTMELVAGEQMTVENLLYGILVHSANDAAVSIARSYGYDAFIRLMNKKAEAIGMRDSEFANPHGFDSPSQFTTPYDLALAAQELLKNPYLAKFVSTKEITISDVNYTRFHRLSNVNRLLGEVVGMGGLKTGYTELAGENLVSYYTKGGRKYIVVVMKSLDRFTDTLALTRWIDEAMRYVPMPQELKDFRY